MLPKKKNQRLAVPEELSDIKRSDLGTEFARLQRELAETDRSMLVIVDGWESSGKGFLLKDLTRELDPKLYEVEVFEEGNDEETQHHYLYRFFKKSPQKGHIAFFDRSFYYDLFSDFEFEEEKLAHYTEDIAFVEEALLNDDTLIIKFFLHQTESEMRNRMEELEVHEHKRVLLSDRDYKQLNHYDEFYTHFQEVLEESNFERSPWTILYYEGAKDTSRFALQECIDRLREFLGEDLERPEPVLESQLDDSDFHLDQFDLEGSISDEEYDEILNDLQERAGDLLYQCYLEDKQIVIMYEGTDAAGKGGNIRRLTRQMDPRGYDVATVSAPTQHELNHHHLWRFNEELPVKGRMTIFDRSWYGRVLVERVEDLTPAYRWKEAYSEINQMEHNLAHQDILVLKYLLIIDPEEQLTRFEARADDPDKEHKLTDEDWRNHQKFDDYQEAMTDMLHYTSTEETPWTVVSGMSKKYARIKVLKNFIARTETYLDEIQDFEKK